MSHRRGVQQSVLSLMVRKKYRRKLRLSIDLQTNLTSQLITGEVDNSTLDTIAQRPNITLVDESPELKELLDAIIARKEGKALGRCGIPAEIWKHVKLASSLYKLSLQIWENEEIPKDWKDAIIICQSSRMEEERTVGTIEVFLFSQQPKRSLLAYSSTD